MDNSTKLSHVLHYKNESNRSNSKLHSRTNPTQLWKQIHDIEISESILILNKVHSKIGADLVLLL